MLTKIDTVTVPSFWLTAIFNADYSGMNPTDKLDLELFLDEYPSATFDVKSYDTFFAYCNYINLHADCVELDIYENTKRKG